MFVVSPDASLSLVALGLAAIALEFVRPGWVVPAVVGCILVVFGAYSFSHYELDPAGLILTAVGFALCGLEARLQTRGVLGLAAAGAMVAGTLRLVPRQPIHLAIALATSLPLAAMLSVLLSLAWRARRNKRSTIF